MQAGAVVQQVRLGDVAAHAVAQQHDGHARMLLADVLVEAGQVTHHFAPAVGVGVVPQDPVVGSLAVSALVQGIHAVPLVTQLFGQACVACAMFRHSMGHQDHGLERTLRQPLVDEQLAVVVRGQPERIVDHGDSFARGRCIV